jgi:hypothetical protein
MLTVYTTQQMMQSEPMTIVASRNNPITPGKVSMTNQKVSDCQFRTGHTPKN